MKKDDPQTAAIKRNAIELAELACEDVREEMRQSDIIFGYDTGRDCLVLFYGVAMLKRVVRRGNAESAKTMAVRYDQESGEQLEYLAAYVKALKGACCYESGDA